MDVPPTAFGGMLAATVAALGVLHCASPARPRSHGEPPRTPVEMGGEHELAAFRAALQPLRLLELQRRARDEGIDLDTVEEAFDSEDPTEATVELLVQHRRKAISRSDDCVFRLYKVHG